MGRPQDSMTRILPTLYTLTLGLFGIAALIALTDFRALGASFAPLAFFAALSMFVKRAGFHVAPQVTHSLVGVVDLAAVLIFGPILGAWVAAVSGFLYLFLNAWRHERHAAFNLIQIPIFNAGLKIGMAYASTHLYTLLGGKFPPRDFALDDLPALVAAAFAWFAVDHLGWAVLEWTRGGLPAVSEFFRRVLVHSLYTELLPLPFAMLIALVYDSTNPEPFLLLAAGLVGTAVIVQRFADASARLEQRRHELTVLNEFGQALARAGFESERIVDLWYENARRILPADWYCVEFFERGNGLIVLQADAQHTTHPYATVRDSARARYFLNRRESLRLDRARPDAKIFDDLLASRSDVLHILSVPLWAGDQLLGAFTLLSKHPRAYLPIHARNLESMCGQAAVTIQNARLYAAERKRATQLETISEVSREVAASLDLDEFLQSVVTRIRERFGYSHVHVFTVDKESGYVVFRASTHPRGVSWRARGIGYRIGLEGIVGWVAAMGEPMLVNDVSQEPRFAPYPEKAIDETKSEIVVPMMIGGQVIGVLDVESDQQNAFDDEDLFILKTLAAQMATALQDARLYIAQKEEAYYLNVLLQVAQNLSTTTDLGDALETVVRITPLLVGVERCAIFLCDPATKMFAAAKAYGLAPELLDAFQRLRFRSDDASAFAQMYREQKPLMIQEATARELLRADFLATFDIRSLLLVPLISRGEVAGAMIVDQGSRQTQFSQHEIDVLTGIATQAAVAIESTRLSAEAEEKKRMDYELQLARTIQKSFLPAACPAVAGYEICSHWQTAREVSGDFYDFIPLSGGRIGITIADVSDKGMAAALFMALSRTILRTMVIGKATPREAVERANDVILADAQSEMFVTACHAALDPVRHTLTWVNAGHIPPFLYRAARNELQTLERHGIALGVVPNITLEEHTLALEAGDVIVFYTDGVTDAINAREEEFGVERLADLVRANARASAEEIVRAVCDAVAEFVGAGAAFDDLTMVVVKQTSPHSPAARPLSPLLTERQERGEGGKGGEG